MITKLFVCSNAMQALRHSRRVFFEILSFQLMYKYFYAIVKPEDTLSVK